MQKQNKQTNKKTKQQQQNTPVNEGVLIPNFTPKYVWAQTFKPAVTKTTPFFLKNWHLQIPQIEKKTPFSSFFQILKHVLRVVLKKTPFYVFYVCVHLHIWVPPPPGAAIFDAKITFPEIIKIGLL